MLGRGWIISAVLSILIFAGLVIFFRAFFISGNAASSPEMKQQALGESKVVVTLSPSPVATPKTTVATKAAAVAPSPSLTPTPKPSPSPQPSPSKPMYVIAAFGDSMVDTMGENLEYLQKSLNKRYPHTEFKLYNYGIGSQNAVEAIKRFDSQFSNKTRNFPPIGSINADIIILASFAYNPLEPYNRENHKNALKDLAEKSKATGARVYLLAEIAPLKEGFGKGAGGVNWPDEKVKVHVSEIIEQLENAVILSRELKIPLINAFEKSKVNGNFGNKNYVSTHDGIHPSIEGEIFMAEVIAQTLKLP